MAIEFEYNEEYFFELYDREVVFDMLIVELKDLEWQFFELFIDFVMIGLFLRWEIADKEFQEFQSLDLIVDREREIEKTLEVDSGVSG
jgi:hypothetical protein